MWIKAPSGDYVDTDQIIAVHVKVFDWNKCNYIRVHALHAHGCYTELANQETLKSEADARTFAAEFVAKYLSKEGANND